MSVRRLYDRVADPERRPDLADQVFWRGHADQLDEVHHRLRSLTGDGMREPGLAEPARAEDRDHPRGGEQRPHPPEVVVAAEQRGRVEPHPDAYGAVERQQRTVHPPQLRADVGADPVAQVRPITLEAVERGARSTHRRLAVQEIGEQSLVLGVEARGLLELGQRDVVVAAPAPRPGEHDPRGRQVVFRAQAHLGQRAVTLRRRRPGAQRERLLGRRPRRGRILGEQRRRLVRQGVQPPGVDAVGRDVEPVSAPFRDQRLRPHDRPRPGHQDLQRLRRVGRFAVSPHVRDELLGVHGPGGEREGGEQRLSPLADHRLPPPPHTVEQAQVDRHAASLGSGEPRHGAVRNVKCSLPTTTGLRSSPISSIVTVITSPARNRKSISGTTPVPVARTAPWGWFSEWKR